MFKWLYNYIIKFDLFEDYVRVIVEIKVGEFVG